VRNQSKVEVISRGVLAAPGGYEELVFVGAGAAAGVGTAGPVAIWAAPGDGAILLALGTAFPRSKPSASVSVALAHYSDWSETDNGLIRATEVVVVRGFDLAFPFLQRLADGRFLVVGARCSLRGPSVAPAPR
jgi:hypothetical protein